MSINHTLLLRQLKRLGIDISSGQTPTAEQWLHLLDRVNQAYTETDQERYLLERSQEISSRELRELYTRIEESQRIAGFGNWFFNRTTGKGQWSKECFRIFGANPESLMPSYRELSRQVHRNDRVALKNRAKTAVQDGKDFEIEFRFLLGNGETRWVWLKGQPVKDANGIVNCLHGTVMDVTRRKVVELRQSMEHTITRLLAESGSLEDAIPEIIQAVCETLGWACGALWTLDRHKGSLRRTVTWSLPRARTEEFFYTTKQVIDILTYEDLIGQTLRAKVPIWNPDVTQDANFLRGDAARAAGLRAAFAFPIQAREETLGVMEFFGKQAQQVDQEMLQSAHFISRHIGQFLQRKQAEDALREREAHFRALVEQASDSFYVHDVEGRIIDVNQHGCDCLGYTREELLSMKVRDIDGGLSPAELTYLQDQTINKAIALESRHRRKDGSTFPVEIRMGPIEIDGHRHLLSLVRDVTERKELQDHIQHLAYHDPLTNLPNRAMFNRHLSHAIAQAQRHRKGLAVLFIDLDRFKNINDTLGHNAGDQLLQEMARRITSCLRGSDIVSRSGNNADMVARLGGDEFVVLIEEIKDSARVGHIARRILAAMVKEFPLDGQLIHITASIGISTFPEDGCNEFLLMKYADIAMYRAKEKGKNNFQFYSTQMDLHSTELLTLESGLHRALERNEFILFYQPKVEAQSGYITGVEALVRWQHPELGMVSPDQFIPIAEESGRIVPLSQWVLREACRQNCAWQQQGLPALRMAVNLSARQFVDDNLLNDIVTALNEVGMNPSLLELEITESTMMQNTEKTVQTLVELRSMGIRVAIDDFGIAYSSLSHLKRFPIDIIKIDRSFVKDIPGDNADEAIIEAIIAMSKSLKMAVVAEGVETAKQVQFLRERGCNQMQGYFFSRPIPANDFAKLMHKNLATEES